MYWKPFDAFNVSYVTDKSMQVYLIFKFLSSITLLYCFMPTAKWKWSSADTWSRDYKYISEINIKAGTIDFPFPDLKTSFG